MFPIKDVVDYVRLHMGGNTRESYVNKAVSFEFQARGYRVEREACIPVWFEASNGVKHRLGILQADLVITDELHPLEHHIVEFKITPDTESNRQAAIEQVKSYIRWSELKFMTAWVVFYPKQGEPTIHAVDVPAQ